MGQDWRTRLIHSDVSVPEGFRSLATPVFRGSTTLFSRASDMVDTWNHDDVPYTYGTYGTPTTLTLARRLTALDGAHRCFITPGGQSAIAVVYLSYTASGAHVLVPDSIYGPSRAFANRVLSRHGVEVEYYRPLIGASIEKLIKSSTRLVWCESPGSLTMEVQDVPAIVKAAHRKGVTVALDNTWAAGVLFDAFRHGVDVVVQALTKYVGGHSDRLLGSVRRDRVSAGRLHITGSRDGHIAGRLQSRPERPANARCSPLGHRELSVDHRTMAGSTGRDRHRTASGTRVVPRA